MHQTISIATLAVLAAGVPGCGGGFAEEAATSRAPPSAQSDAWTPPADCHWLAKVLRCQPVSDEVKCRALLEAVPPVVRTQVVQFICISPDGGLVPLLSRAELDRLVAQREAAAAAQQEMQREQAQALAQEQDRAAEAKTARHQQCVQLVELAEAVSLEPPQPDPNRNADDAWEVVYSAIRLAWQRARRACGPSWTPEQQREMDASETSITASRVQRCKSAIDAASQIADRSASAEGPHRSVDVERGVDLRLQRIADAKQVCQSCPEAAAVFAASEDDLKQRAERTAKDDRAARVERAHARELEEAKTAPCNVYRTIAFTKKQLAHEKQVERIGGVVDLTRRRQLAEMLDLLESTVLPNALAKFREVNGRAFARSKDCSGAQ